MKVCLPVLVMFLIMTDVALGAVGGGSVSDGTSSLQPVNGYSAGATGNANGGAAMPSAGPASGGSLAASVGAYVPIQSESSQDVYPESSSSMSGPYQDGYSQQQGIQQSQAAPNAEAVVSSAPQIDGPYQEGMSADDLRLSQPQADTFRPDETLGFVSASMPGDLKPNLNTLDTGANAAAYSPDHGATQGTAPASSSWYYPSSVRSPNRFYIQTHSGLRTVGGCSFGGYLPLWADINAGGNFFVYEWYPGSSTPTAQWWGWSWTGFKKGWFYGDAPGWHILVYNCRYWSNYIYIYVYPSNANYPNPYSGASPDSYYAGTTYSGTGTATSPYAGGYGAASGYTGNAGMMGQTALPSGAPTPPSPGSESLALPDYNSYTPYTDQAMQAAYSGSGYPAQAAISAPTGSGSGYPAQTVMSTSAMSGYPGKSCTACMGSTAAVGGVSGTYPSRGSCPTCTAGSGLTAPYGYVPQSYQAVYPKPSTCRCNEYYVQYYPNRISTVAGMYCDMWLPLWSKISRPGVYWSYEWTCSGSGYYGSPEIRNFGYKNSGWYQTWFGSSNAGWHILSYHCNDWSNYIYIYVWPTS